MAWLVAGCATSGAPPESAGAARTGPDDGDLWNLAPADATAVADVDIAALGRSAWSRSLIKGGLGEDRDQRLRAFGYDVFADVDRMLVVGTEPANTETPLTIVRGRFDAHKVEGAFRGSTPGATSARWREATVFEGGGRAVALVTPQTLVQGTPAAVRAAIDAAWGVVPDAQRGPLGKMRRALDAEAARSAAVLALQVTDEVRARAAGTIEIPSGLRLVGARLDLGHDLDVTGRAVLDDGEGARVAGDIWNTHLGDLRRQPMLRALGLGPLVDGAKLSLHGNEVHARLHVAEDKREALAERVLALLQLIARQRSQAAEP